MKRYQIINTTKDIVVFETNDIMEAAIKYNSYTEQSKEQFIIKDKDNPKNTDIA